MKKHLIVGCGPAGLSALAEIRRITGEDEVKIISRENYLPYSPAVLPYLVAGRSQENAVWLRREDYFKQPGVSFIKGKEVVLLDPEAKEVTYHNGERENYDTLLIASGAKAVKPVIQGLGAGNCFVFHTLDDYHKLGKELAEKKEVCVYGGGLVAVELAVCLLERGCQVKIVVRSSVLRRYFDREIGFLIEETLREKGAQVYTGGEIVDVGEQGERISISLHDGRGFTADILVLAVGVKAETSFLAGVLPDFKDGIPTNNYLETVLPDVYAAGDVAAAPDFFNGLPGVSPILPNALEQGRIAGANMAGQKVFYEGWVPMNLLYYFGNLAFSIGRVNSPGSNEQVVEEKFPQEKKFKKLVFQGDYLVGAQFLNFVVDPGVFRYLITRRVKIGPYKELLGAQPRETGYWLMDTNEQKDTLIV